MRGLGEYILFQYIWSRRTFGPGRRTKAILRHIEKELAEIRAAPTDLEEWVDVVILALDGAWRAGHKPSEIVAALDRKQDINFSRKWPPPGPEDQPTEHIAHADAPRASSGSVRRDVGTGGHNA